MAGQPPSGVTRGPCPFSEQPALPCAAAPDAQVSSGQTPTLGFERPLHARGRTTSS